MASGRLFTGNNTGTNPQSRVLGLTGLPLLTAARAAVDTWPLTRERLFQVHLSPGADDRSAPHRGRHQKYSLYWPTGQTITAIVRDVTTDPI